MICSEVTALLDLMLDCELDDDRVYRVAEHLDSCESCASAWSELKVLQQRVRGFLGEMQLSKETLVQIQSKLALESSSVLQPPSAPVKQAASPVSEVAFASESPIRSAYSHANTPAFRPRTIICERHELIRFGLKRVVSERVEVVGEAADGMAAMESIRRLRPDLVILDLDLDILNGVEICRRIHDEMSNTMVLVLTDSYHATKYYNQLIRASAQGFCLKSSGPRTLFEAIENTSRGLPYCDPKILQLVKQTPTTVFPNSGLTDREIEVLIRLDLRNKEIAEDLDMKLRTVEKHIECILAKLKVPTRTAAALKAVQQGYTLLPKMPGRDSSTGSTHEQVVAELQAELAIANEHLKALLKQNNLLSGALSDKLEDGHKLNRA